ncbi:FkbM family methyltransferase [Leptospira wolffii]|uniref:FkbM family methyltransferase n=1 Tax=Leptospira wolffii TaxID=409998 RepID=A0ABV5BKC7_9LEPT
MNNIAKFKEEIIIKDQLNLFQKFLRKFEKLELLVPKQIRVPFRYFAQKFLGALEPEMKFLKSLSGPGKLVLDIGANRGIYAYALSKIAEKVVCFEPIPECSKYIRDFKSNKIEVISVALSDKPGKLEFYIPILKGRLTLTRASLAKPDPPFESIQVEIRTLDSYDFPKIDFIKIDVEGFEAKVLQGGMNTLKRWTPNLLIEIDLRRISVDSFLWIFDELAKIGYVPYTVKSGKLTICPDPLTEAKVNYNFIFKKK